MIWNLNFDTLLALFNDGPVEAKGFADDLSLTVCGPDPGTLVQIMQHAMNRAVEWGHEHGLSFSQVKTEAVVFNRKRNPPPFRPLMLHGIPIRYVTSARYLGVILDSRLTFAEHVRIQCRKGIRFFMALKGAIGQLWGPSPCAMKWACDMIIKPMVLFGSIVWAHRTRHTNRHLSRLQRLALLSLGHFPRSAPTKGLEVILGFTLLDLLAKERAHRTYVWIRNRNPHRWDVHGLSNARGHLLSLIHI